MPRYVVVGAGAVGGTIGGRLATAGRDVTLVARGAHGDAIRAGGLLLREPDGEARLAIPCVASPGDVGWRDDDIVLLATKLHQAEAALDALAAAAPPSIAVVCATNGLAGEPMALRRFARTYGIVVNLPAEHLTPGIVTSYGAPCPGILDVGRYPDGADDMATAIAGDLTAAGFASRTDADIMRRKRQKLRLNLANVLQAACGQADAADLWSAARREAEDAFRAAGLDWTSDDADRARREEAGLGMRPVAGGRHTGGSTWQSVARGTGATEADYLNGEVVLLGRLHGVATPVNELLQRVARELATSGADPGSMHPDRLREQLR